MKIVVIILILSILTPFVALAQRKVEDIIIPDTTGISQRMDKSEKFYDNLKTKSDSSKFFRMFYRTVVTNPHRDDFFEESAETKITKEVEYFNQHEGAQINNIYIYRNNVFEDIYTKGNLRNVANSLHKVTREKKIRNSLLFNEGDILQPDVMAKNQQVLRELNYLSNANIVVIPTKADENQVDVFIFTRDKWTISADISSVENHNYFLNTYDNNFLGTGNKFGIRTYVSMKNNHYGGNIIDYGINNAWGSFFNIDISVGKGYEEYILYGKMSKDFILRNDYMLGVKVDESKYYERQVLTDTALLIGGRKVDIWAGKSWYVNPIKSSIYISTAYLNYKYKDRPEVRPDSNSYYHDRRLALVSLGAYRESFYRGNMIHGFGTPEDIPYGHKIELTGGHYWGEFSNKWYLGINASAGRQTNFGYIRAEAMADTYISPDRKSQQATLGVNINYFSNLFKIGNSNLRQFMDIRHMRGYNRHNGEGEQLAFYRADAPRGIAGDLIYGKNRFVINTETVVFTPLYLYGFRFAFFAFGDVGWLGDRSAFYENDFYSTIGVGVRLKNERLIFKTIQLRFGFAIGNKGLADYNYFRFSNESRLNIPRYKPQGPDVIMYR